MFTFFFELVHYFACVQYTTLQLARKPYPPHWFSPPTRTVRIEIFGVCAEFCAIFAETRLQGEVQKRKVCGGLGRMKFAQMPREDAVRTANKDG
jgi:hypothetical protein